MESEEKPKRFKISYAIGFGLSESFEQEIEDRMIELGYMPIARRIDIMTDVRDLCFELKD